MERCLPYVSASAATVHYGYSVDWSSGQTYTGGNEALDRAVGEIQNTYLTRDSDALNALIPSSGDVAIFTDGAYDYSLSCDQFQQMLGDGSQNVDTASFQVTQVLDEGDGEAVVRATHTVNDPDGNQDTVYQLYRLRNENGQYVISDFMTSHDTL